MTYCMFMFFNADDVIVGSTGVIGVNLPMDKLEAGIKDAVANLSAWILLQ